MSNKRVSDLITRRRRQILVHSVIYYKYDSNLISDHQWNAWAQELANLQKNYPGIASECPLAEMFKDFDGSTGAFLPLDDPWANDQAKFLLGMKDRGLFDREYICD